MYKTLVPPAGTFPMPASAVPWYWPYFKPVCLLREPKREVGVDSSHCRRARTL